MSTRVDREAVACVLVAAAALLAVLSLAGDRPVAARPVLSPARVTGAAAGMPRCGHPGFWPAGFGAAAGCPGGEAVPHSP